LCQASVSNPLTMEPQAAWQAHSWHFACCTPLRAALSRCLESGDAGVRVCCTSRLPNLYALVPARGGLLQCGLTSECSQRRLGYHAGCWSLWLRGDACVSELGLFICAPELMHAWVFPALCCVCAAVELPRASHGVHALLVPCSCWSSWPAAQLVAQPHSSSACRTHSCCSPIGMHL
jgi:hypothetical protein